VYLPQIDVCERPEEVVILVEVPGIERQDVSISWRDSVLVISGQKRQMSSTGNARYMCVECAYGPFRREIAIGIPIDYKKARAELRNGLMKIFLPKIFEEGRTESIPIE